MSKLTTHEKEKGFTLIEILLSLSVVVVITGVLIPSYHLLQGRNDLDIATVSTVQSLRRAQILSQVVDGDSSWGVYVQEESITLFQGESYTNRDSDFDEVLSMSPAIVPSGTREFVYTKFSGTPENVGTLTLTLDDNANKDITINAKGTITY